MKQGGKQIVVVDGMRTILPKSIVTAHFLSPSLAHKFTGRAWCYLLEALGFKVVEIIQSVLVKVLVCFSCDIARSRLLDMVSGRYNDAVDEYINLLNGKLEPNEDEIFGLVSTLKKVECCINCHNMGHCDIWKSKSTFTSNLESQNCLK